MQRFGEKLRILREQHDLTKTALGQMLGHKTHTHVSALESGRKRPSLDLALKIADLFEVDINLLIRDNLELSGSR